MKGGWAGSQSERFHVKHRISLDALQDMCFAVVSLVFYEDTDLGEAQLENAARCVMRVLQGYSGRKEKWHEHFAVALLADVVAAVHLRVRLPEEDFATVDQSTGSKSVESSVTTRGTTSSQTP